MQVEGRTLELFAGRHSRGLQVAIRQRLIPVLDEANLRSPERLVREPLMPYK
jgi:hypothetical protein